MKLVYFGVFALELSSLLDNSLAKFNIWEMSHAVSIALLDRSELYCSKVHKLYIDIGYPLI